MKRAALLCAFLLAAATYVYLQQTAAPPAGLASFMPGGALVYLEAPEFGRLLRDWDASRVKADWLASENYAVFSRSNLFTKLSQVYAEYGETAGFLPDLKSLIEIAGSQSALALYEIRDVEFLYVSRIAESDVVASPLWAVRAKFEERQAGGVTFYQRTDAATKRTVAFAFAKGYLILGTREDLVAQSLELLAGGANPSIAGDRWYRDALAQAAGPGELRLVMNLESLVKSVYFRSYWVQRNASAVRRYWAGVAEVTRSPGEIAERRVFLRTPDVAVPAEGADPATVAGLVALVPPEAGVYKAFPIKESTGTASLIVAKLIGSPEQHRRDWRDAPYAVSPDNRAGSEADLETRIDEQPLPADAGNADSVAAIDAMVRQAGAHGMLLVQSSSAAAGTFVQTPTAIVLAANTEWSPDSVRVALGNAAGKLWTTSQLGAQWVASTSGAHSVQRLDGLGSLLFVTRGRLLFVSNDSWLLASVLDRTRVPPAAGVFTYAAGFRHLRERTNYERVMAALDFVSPATNLGFFRAEVRGVPTFFSGNLGSLSRVLSSVAEVGITEEDRGSATIQTVRYQFGK
jgi:hypothetical protein